MSTDLKLSKAQITKVIKSGRFLGFLLSKFADDCARSPVFWARKSVFLPVKSTIVTNSFVLLPEVTKFLLFKNLGTPSPVNFIFEKTWGMETDSESIKSSVFC